MQLRMLPTKWEKLANHSPSSTILGHNTITCMCLKSLHMRSARKVWLHVVDKLIIPPLLDE